MMLVACGTAHYACHVASTGSRRSPAAPVEIEVRLRVPLSRAAARRHARVFVSQSGGDRRHARRAALRARRKGADRFGGERRRLDHRPRERRGATILAGPEIGVASTKAFTCQLTVLATLALAARAAAASPPLRRSASPARSAACRADGAALAMEPRDRRDRPRSLAGARTCCSSGAARCIRWRSRAR